MKKFLFLMGGVVTLTACSEDIFQEIDNSNDFDPQYTTNTYTGSVGDTNYKSPWNIDSLRSVSYSFDSNVVNWENIYVRVTPYIGLAYYDGADDGIYNTPTGSFNLAAGNYPNLFALNKEYGNYVQANPIVLGSPRQTGINGWYTHELTIQSREYHCPLTNVPVGLNYNLYAIGFDIMNNSTIQPAAHLTGASVSPPPAAGTADEELLLGQYGKVFYYKVEYSYTGDPYNYHPDVYYVLSLEVANINDPEWTKILDASTLSGYYEDTFNGYLSFYDNGGSGSKEIVVDPISFFNEATGQVRSNSWFNTSSGFRKIYTLPYFPPFPGAEPRGISIYFD